MISEETLQNYINQHLLATTLNAFSTTEKNAARFAADLDVAAVFGRSIGDADGALLCAAVAEQAIHLLLHRDVLSRPESHTDLVSESIDGVGSRSFSTKRNEPAQLCERAQRYLDGAMTSPMQLKRG